MQYSFNFLIRKRKGAKERPASSIPEEYGRILSLFSLIFLVITALEYWKGSNITAIISSYPLWFIGFFCSLPAILAWLIFHSKSGLVIFCLWASFIVISNDHLPAISRIGKEANDIHPAHEAKAHRLVSFDCTGIDAFDPEYFRQLNPSIIFLQQVGENHHIRQLGFELFGTKAIVKSHGNCAIITNGGKLTVSDQTDMETIPSLNGLIIDWSPDHISDTIRLVNVNLEYTDLFKSILVPSSWKYYASKRYIHRTQIQNLLFKLKNIEAEKGELPILIGGNFAEQEKSPIFKPLTNLFSDSYSQYSNTYGATFPSELPLFRMNRILGCSLINFYHAGVLYIPNASRKAVFADFYLN